MNRSQLWTIDVSLRNEATSVRAQVRIRGADDHSYLGVGLVRTDLQHMSSETLAGELAIARALTDLTEELLEAVSAEIDALPMLESSSVHHELAQ